MISIFFSRAVILLAGTLYPAYRSYKAVKTKDTKEYVKWMMYWIVFALFCVCESVADFIVAFWFPFYYEMKIVFVLWLINPWTKGASILYRKWIHPLFLEHEEEIDTFIEQAKTESYRQVFNLGSRGLMCAREIVASAALRGIMAQQETLQRSYSMDDVSARKITALKAAARVREIEHDASAPSRLNEKMAAEQSEARDDIEEEEKVRTWSGAYDDRGRIVEQSVTKIAEEEMILINDPSTVGVVTRRTTRQSRSRGRKDVQVESNTLPRRSSRRRSVNSESIAQHSK